MRSQRSSSSSGHTNATVVPQTPSLPATLTESLQEYYTAHMRHEQQQQQRQQQQQQQPPVQESPPPSRPRLSASAAAPVDVLTHIRKASERLSSSAARSSSGARDADELGRLSSSAAVHRSVSPPNSVATAAPAQQRRQTWTDADAAPPPRSAPEVGHTHVHLSPSSPSSSSASPLPRQTNAAEELLHTRRQLEEMRRLYAFEKQAHLQHRTRQLREEAQQRQDDDGVTERTVQLLTDYETLVRHRDVASRKHLSEVVQRVADEWQRQAAELEHTRAACEAHLLARLHDAVAEQQADLAARLQRHLLSVAASTAEAERAQHAAIATAVREQVDSLQGEYRALLEHDMAERTRLMDEQVAHRETQWRRFLTEEHASMIAAGEAAAREASRRQLETLHAAMRDVTGLRRQLLQEHTRRQAEVGQAYIDAYGSLAGEYVAAAEETAEFVQGLQRDYAGVIAALHAEVRRVEEEKQEAVRLAAQCSAQVADAVARQLHDVEAGVEARWQSRWAAEQAAHHAAVLQLTDAQEAALEKVRRADAAEAARLCRQHDEERASWQDSLARRDDAHAVAVEEERRTAQAVLQRVEAERNALAVRVRDLTAEQQRASVAHEAALLDVRRAEEVRFSAQLRALQESYDEVLLQYKETTKAASNSGGTATSSTAATALARVAELETALSEVRAVHATQVQQAVQEAAALWSARLEDLRRQQRSDGEAVEQQHRALRASLLDEVRQREEALEETHAGLRQRHAEAVQEAVQREREAAQWARERLERHYEAERRTAAAESEARLRACEEVVVMREKRLEAAEAEWQQRRAQDQDAALRRVAEHAAAAQATQLTALEAREARLAQQLVVAEQELRGRVRREMDVQLVERLDAAAADWTRLMEAELQRRLATWQEARGQELESVLRMHCEQVRLLHAHHTAQLTTLLDAQQQRVAEDAEAMRTREAAWAAARAASLDEMQHAAAARLQEVRVAEQTQWDATREQRAAERRASIDAIARETADRLAAAEEARAQVEAEISASHESLRHQYQVKMSAALAEQRSTHDAAMAQARAEAAAALQRTAAALQQQHETHLDEVRTAYEEQLAAQRGSHAAALAAAHSTAQERATRREREVDAALEEHEAAAAARLHEVRRAHDQRIEALQRRCDAQARELRDADVRSMALAQRIHEEEEGKLRTEYEASLAGLRDALEARNVAYAGLQVSLYTRVQAEADRVQAATEERLAHVAEQLQQRQQADLAQLRTSHAAELAAQAQRLRDAHAAATEAQETRWAALLEDERRDRRAAEERAVTAEAEVAELRVSVEQQRAVAHRDLDDEYRGLLEQLRHTVQEERTELARRSLEAEELRFAAEVLRHRPPPRRASPATATTPIVVAAPAIPATSVAGRTARVARAAAAAAAAAAGGTPPHQQQQQRRSSPHLLTPPAAAVDCSETNDDEDSGGVGGSGVAVVLQRAARRLQQLWEVLETPTAEQHAFLADAHALAQWTPVAELQDVLTREQRRLEAQLPLLEAMTRREYVQRQLHSMEGVAPLALLSVNSSSRSTRSAAAHKRVSGDDDEDKDESRDGGVRITMAAELQQQSPSSSPFTDGSTRDVSLSAAVSPPTKTRSGGTANKQKQQQKQQLEQLRLELHRLTEQLRRDVTAHEKQYAQLFCVHGTRVMDTL
ncbi:LTXXQ motif family protein [Novymonas esmeraldas]|uniref:LTXXQ motif family protein n=1 Tax=Novymonas esmeraldas TaxID=1808958 RepID=A0AAW0EL99_9TRYP